MNVSLRKANAIQNLISETIKSIKITYSIDLNEFENPELSIKTANDELFDNDARRHALLLALYNIRGLVGVANVHSGINDKLAMAAFIDKRISQLDELITLKPLTSFDVIKGKLEKIRNRKEETRASLYGRDDVVSTSVVSQEQINQAREELKKLKKQKQKINDEVLELNITTEVPLSDDIVNTLQKEGII